MSLNKSTTKAANRSKKYRSNLEKIEKTMDSKPVLSIAEALSLLLSLKQPTFKDGASVELHVKLNINPTRSDQLVRGNVVLPHGTGKKVRIAAFVTPENVDKALKAGAAIAGGEDLVDQIKNTETTDFDISIAQPDMMKKLPSIARILGTRGLMPNPKSGTVGDNIEEMISLINAGKVEFKNDKSSNIHIACGKINSSFTLEQLNENVTAAMEAVEKFRPEVIKKKYILSAHLASSQSPSIKIQ